MVDLTPLDRAVRAARRGHDEAARRLLDAVLMDDRDNELALAWRARVEGDPDTKAGFLQRVLALNPNATWATDALARLGDVTEAATPGSTGSLDTVGRRAARIDHLQCPNCGGQVEIHPERGSKSVACQHCGSVLDLTSKQLDVIGRFKRRFEPAQDILPGAEATIDGERHVVMGWLRYKGWDSEESWTWDEWQLLGDSGAVRYLSWSRDEGFLLQTPVRPTPTTTRAGIELPNGRVSFYETSPASITGMAGELTWRPRLDATLQVGEAKKGGVQYSAELTADEVEVVAGSRMGDLEVWEAFGRTDKVEAIRERQERGRRRRRSAAGIARLFGLGGIAFLALGIWIVPRLGSDVGQAAHTVESGPVSLDAEVAALLPPVEGGPPGFERATDVLRNARDLVRYDTIEAGTVRLSEGRAYVVQVGATPPVAPPRGVDVEVAFIDPGDGDVFQPSVSPLVSANSAPTTEDSRPFRVDVSDGDEAAFRVVLLVGREWSGRESDGPLAWTEPVSFPISATVRHAWLPGPFYVAAAFSLFVAFAFFVFSRTGPR
ncbi:DUF4178 domain-containing protein [Rubrivirga marina]|uniref:DUF4178 domain-containing protein n=1 Tax=Rubrivirga marina TaxID=1196024 RepID=A0A271IYV4_9BACT|nr:DUF4178 domain-containing protein [Rubrivirga marina]PAP76148.1 hypothetical protein BSZ37_06655 [Rubrivirga marina]